MITKEQLLETLKELESSAKTKATRADGIVEYFSPWNQKAIAYGVCLSLVEVLK